MENFPDLTGSVGEIVAVVMALLGFGIFLTKMNENIKSILNLILAGVQRSIYSRRKREVKKEWKLWPFMWLVSILSGVGMIVTVAWIFPELFPFTLPMAVFFGVLVGLSASEFHDAWLGSGKNKQKIVVETKPPVIPEVQETPSIHDTESLSDKW